MFLRRHQEWIGIGACAILYLMLRVWGLREQAVNTLFDEGVHLALMQRLAETGDTLYRDVLFIHPPGLILVGAWLWRRLHGDLFALRLLYIGFCSLAHIPLYLLARRLYSVRVALLTLFLIAVTPGFAGWTGRNIFLELPLNVFLYTALWLLLAVPNSRLASPMLAGLLLGVGFLVKETALVMVVAILTAWIITLFSSAPQRGEEPERPLPETFLSQDSRSFAFLRGAPPSSVRQLKREGVSLLWFGLVSLALIGLLLGLLARQPHYVRDTFTLNAHDPFNWRLRPYELLNGFYQLPLQLTFGVAGVFWMLRRGRTREERFLGLFTLLMALLMLFVPKRFFWRYLLPVMPLCSLGVALWWERFRAMPRPLWRRAATFGFLALCGLLHLVTLILYHTKEAPDPPAYQEALRLLRASPAPLFTLDPIWAAASGKPLSRWEFACDAVFARQYGLAAPADFTRALRGCPVALLDKKTQELLPSETERVLRQEYRPVFHYGAPGERHYVEIWRRLTAPVPLPEQSAGKGEFTGMKGRIQKRGANPR